MDLDFIKDKKNHITVSGFENGTISGISDIHTVKDPITWVASDGTFAWIKLNVYELDFLTDINFTWAGSYTDFTIEKSIDNINWETINVAFSETLNIVELEYSNIEFIFIRITITDPLGFSLTQFEIWGDNEVNIQDFISHNYHRFYSSKIIETKSFFPEIQKEIMRMWEGNNDLNLKLFDETLFTNSNISATPTGDVIIFTPNIPTITDATYIWDFDEYLLEADIDYDTNNPNIIVEIIPSIQTYTYKKVGLHIPRLILRTPTFSLEFTESFIKV